MHPMVYHQQMNKILIDPQNQFLYHLGVFFLQQYTTSYHPRHTNHSRSTHLLQFLDSKSIFLYDRFQFHCPGCYQWHQHFLISFVPIFLFDVVSFLNEVLFGVSVFSCVFYIFLSRHRHVAQQDALESLILALRCREVLLFLCSHH